MKNEEIKIHNLVKTTEANVYDIVEDPIFQHQNSTITQELSNKSSKKLNPMNNPELQKRIEVLVDKKKEILKKSEIETEYRNSIREMIENERKDHKFYVEQCFEVSEKMGKINLSHKNLQDNAKSTTKKTTNMKRVKKDLNEDIAKMNSLLSLQYNKIESMKQEIDFETQKMLKEKDRVKDKYIVMERETKLKKDDLKNKIKKTESLKKNKINEDNYIIKIVLGLDLTKR
jgi:hypothetical protein